MQRDAFLRAWSDPGRDDDAPGRRRYRSVWISDIHLGSRNCHAHALAAFLAGLSCDRLYLVGDIVDLWWMSRARTAWQHDHTLIVERLHAMAKAGTELVYNYSFELDSWQEHPCGCGSPRCPGYIVDEDLWPKLRKKISARKAWEPRRRNGKGPTPLPVSASERDKAA